MAGQSYLTPGDVAEVKQALSNVEATFKAFWTDAYVVWTLNRPDGWDTGAEPEGWHIVETGIGKLRPGGVAGPGDLADETVIFNEAQYEFKVESTTVLGTSDLLVTNGRVFHVDRVVRKSSERTVAKAHLTERVGDDVPAEVAP